MKTKPITRERNGADRKTARSERPHVDYDKINSPAAFEPDEDTPVLTLRELREMRRVSDDVDVGVLRRKLKLSQGAFAKLFDLPLGTVKDWEQGRRMPDAPARAYLRVIARDPKAVRRALSAAAG